MKVWHCDDYRPVPGLVPAEVETPRPQRGEVLIRVHAVGVTHTELLWQPTTHTKSGAAPAIRNTRALTDPWGRPSPRHPNTAPRRRRFPEPRPAAPTWRYPRNTPTRRRRP